MPDIAWLRPDGTEMQPEDWESGFGRAIGVFLNGAGIRERDRRGEEIRDRHFFILFNAGDEGVAFTIPRPEFSPEWEIVVDTTGELTDTRPRAGGEELDVAGRSLVVLREYEPEQQPATDHSVAASLAAFTAPIDVVRSPAPQPELPH